MNELTSENLEGKHDSKAKGLAEMDFELLLMHQRATSVILRKLVTSYLGRTGLPS
jgi:hypothetical protein